MKAVSKPSKPLNEIIIEYLEFRVDFLTGAGALRNAIRDLTEARKRVEGSRAKLLDLSREIGPRLSADVAGVIGGAKLDEAALDAMLEEARKVLGELTEYEQQVSAAKAKAVADAAQ